jgi:hypothetical protein
MAKEGHPSAGAQSTADAQFQTSDRCVACHNGMSGTNGEEVSIGIDWSASMMANASRDPYWQASVRRESVDHPESRAAIENECSACHMPIPHYQANQRGQLGQVFAHLQPRANAMRSAADGVSCSVCHQIAARNLGTAASFNGNFSIAEPAVDGARAEFGPYDIEAGLQRVMRTSTGGFEPTHGDQTRAAELCATCHTLITQARGVNGAIIGSLPEQMPYQEWVHSDFHNERSCQSCHMPAVQTEVPITRILGANRPGVARHQFVGANFVMQRILSRYHDELRVAAPGEELAAAADRTVRYLRANAATLTIAPPELRHGRVEEDVSVQNRSGHKFPTAYPARRAWLHVVVRDRDHRTLFESGALNADGSIAGNDNDSDPAHYEPHYSQIRTADQVQIYETILGDSGGGVTTGLLSAVGYLKDNRLLPRGFDKNTASADIAVHGDALSDPQFTDFGHRLRYSIDIGTAPGPFEIVVELWYQPIGFRWADNLKRYSDDEPHKFSGYFDSMGAGNAILLAEASRTAR